MATIENRGNKTWRLTVELGFDSQGKRMRERRTVKGFTKREAEKELAKFVTEIEAGDYIAPEKMTFSEFAVEWEKKYAKKELALKTLTTYLCHLKNHIIPALGHIRIDQIKPLHIITLLDDLSKPGARIDGKGDTLSSGTIEYIHRIMKNLFNRAVDWKLIKSHPMQGIKKPRVKHATIQYYNQEEAKLAINALSKESIMWRLYCIGALIGGFRRGELLALEWSDIDYNEQTISIKESISLTVKGNAIITEPKTKSSSAKVDMPKWYMDDLKKYQDIWMEEKNLLGDEWLGGDREFIFHGGFGKPLYYSYPSKWWKQFTIRHGIKTISLHGLRHSTATILLENETDMKTIQERLRHASYTTTADLYTHVTKKGSRAAAEKFDMFDPALN